MGRRNRKNFSKNPINWEQEEKKQFTKEEKLKFWQSICDWLGMEITLTEEDLINNTYNEEITIRTIRKLQKEDDLKTLKKIKDSGIKDLRLCDYTKEERDYLNSPN